MRVMNRCVSRMFYFGLALPVWLCYERRRAMFVHIFTAETIEDLVK